MPFLDLSHPIENGMPGFRMKQPGGDVVQYSAQIRPFLTHEQSEPFYDGQAAFEITEMSLHTSIGTYLDSPYHRHRDGRDISQLRLEEVILPGIVVDVRGRSAWEPVTEEVLPPGATLRGHAILFNFGWDQHWGQEAYYAYPFIAPALIERLIAEGVALVGVDTLNIDSSQNPARPAHTLLLARDILIVENLTGLEPLHDHPFRFFAVPWKARGAAALPVRAFAEVES